MGGGAAHDDNLEGEVRTRRQGVPKSLDDPVYVVPERPAAKKCLINRIVFCSLCVQGGGAKRRLGGVFENELSQPVPERGRMGRICDRECGRVYLGDEMTGTGERHFPSPLDTHVKSSADRANLRLGQSAQHATRLCQLLAVGKDLAVSVEPQVGVPIL